MEDSVDFDGTENLDYKIEHHETKLADRLFRMRRSQTDGILSYFNTKNKSTCYSESNMPTLLVDGKDVSKLCKIDGLDKYLTKSIINDVQLFGTIIQCLIAFLAIGSLVLTVYLNNYFCFNIYETCSVWCDCNIKTCFEKILIYYLSFINILTGFLTIYDCRQARNKGYRLSIYLFYYLLWSGGWLMYLILFIVWGQRLFYNSIFDMKFSTLSVSILSLITLVAYYYFNF